jgi:ubiquinone/menaquinone biosynthesis C-methylase UbiE
MNNHFDSIAEIYDSLWHFSERYRTQMLDNIVEHLRLTGGDILADIGGGTGAYTQWLKDIAGLEKAYCIEPSRKMYLEARKLPGVEAILADAEEFLGLNLYITKVLLKEVVHHVKAREKLWRHLHAILPAHGRILVVTRPQRTPLPLFKAARLAFGRNQPTCESLLAGLENSGFATSIKLHPYRFALDKRIWHGMIRKRFMSDLAVFDDAEIEEGIAEIDRDHPGDMIEISDDIIYISAWKCS